MVGVDARFWPLAPAPGTENPLTDEQEAVRDAFREFSLPEAVLKFRQGVGRLIRTKTDKGIIVVLDNRILAKRYGRTFLEAMPKCPLEVV